MRVAAACADCRCRRCSLVGYGAGRGRAACGGGRGGVGVCGPGSWEGFCLFGSPCGCCGAVGPRAVGGDVSGSLEAEAGAGRGEYIKGVGG